MRKFEKKQERQEAEKIGNNSYIRKNFVNFSSVIV